MRANRKNRNSWFYQWNYDAPIYWFKDWLKRHHKKIYKIFFKTLAILIGIWLSKAVPTAINDIYADFTNHQIMIKKQKAQIEKEARDRELAYVKHLEEVEKQKKFNEEIRQLEEKRKKQEIEDEIKSEYGLYSWIDITWWWGETHRTGPSAPRTCSRVGQIRKIDGDLIYGTWGDEVLIYQVDHFHTISKKEYLDIRKKEQIQRDREEQKKNKKFKSWGLYPGTVKSQ